MSRFVIGIVITWCSVGCSDRPIVAEGTACELTTDCSDDLVCRLGKCRGECRTSRDCDMERECLVDDDGLGACQVEDGCVFQSECPEGLVCQFRQCVNACANDRDCLRGSRCVSEDGGTACVDMNGMPCERNSDCVDDQLICALDGFCRDECVEDWDCRDGANCAPVGEVFMCVSAGADAGAPTDGGV